MFNNFYELTAHAIEKEMAGHKDGTIPRHLWGYEIIASLKECDHNIIMSLEMVKDFVETGIKKLNMIQIGSPITQFFNDSTGVGASCLALLDSSHFATHTDKVEYAAMIDIFSCNYFTPSPIIDYIKERFQPKEIDYLFILRNPGMVKVLEGV